MSTMMDWIQLILLVVLVDRQLIIRPRYKPAIEVKWSSEGSYAYILWGMAHKVDEDSPYRLYDGWYRVIMINTPWNKKKS